VILQGYSKWLSGF